MQNYLQQFGKFILISFLNTAVDFGSYAVLTRGFEFWSHHQTAANAVALTLTTIHSYVWNSWWVFPGSHQTNLATLSKFLMISISGLAANSGLFWLGIHWGVNEWLLKVGLMGFLFVWSFVGNKWWVYTKQHGA